MPRMVVLEHAIGGDDELSGNGDERDFGGYAVGAHGEIFAFEAFVGPCGAERGAVEGDADARPTALDMVGTGSGSRLVGMRGEAGEAGDGTAVERSQLRQVSCT